jgi:hypothetical protein
MLAALLLAGIVAAPLGSAGLFAGARPHARVTGPWPAARRLVLALIGTAVLAAAAAVVLRLLHATEHNLIAGAAGVVVASLIWLPVTRRWRARAHLCWSSSVFLFAVYLVFALRWTFESHLGLASTAGGVLLWLFEVFAALLSCAYLWEICDALGTEQWRRRITRSSPLTAAEDDLPFASLLGPAQGSHTSSSAPSRSSSPARTSTPATPTPSTSSASTIPSVVPSPTMSVTPSATASASASKPTGTATPTP